MNDNYKKKVITQIAIILSVLVCVVTIKFIGNLPDELDVEYIEQNFIASVESFTAEKTETMMYLASIILFPISYLLFNNILITVLKKSSNENLYSKIYTAVNSIFLMLLVAVTILVYINQPSYFTDGKLCTKIYLIIPFLVLSLALLMFSKKLEQNKWYKIALYIILGVLIATIGYLYIEKVSDSTGYERTHFGAYFYPVLKINSGLTPGIDFNSIYGYYSYILAFLMLPKMYSALLFNLLMATLVVIILFCITIFVNKFVKNKIIATYSIIGIIYCMIVQQLITSGEVYLQYMPHRVIFPALLLFYLVIYLKHLNSNKKELFRIGGFCYLH